VQNNLKKHRFERLAVAFPTFQGPTHVTRTGIQWVTSVSHLYQEKAMLIVVDLLHVQVLSGLEVHDVHVEVVRPRHREQLPQYKNFPVHWKDWLL
jgi:hypothetical protein